MGWLSNILGGSKQDKEMRQVVEQIRRLVEDEQYQNSLMHPTIRSLIEEGPSYDRDPNGVGPFGFLETNPIPVNGSIGELAYLSKIVTNQGERLLFHRIGAFNTVDVFEAVTFSGSAWFVFFLDMYHPKRSCATPDGFRFMSEFGQFSGFHNNCKDFPYDYFETRHSLGETLVSLAYMPSSKIVDQLQNRVFERPLSHKAKLDLVKSRLTSVTSQ